MQTTPHPIISPHDPYHQRTNFDRSTYHNARCTLTMQGICGHAKKVVFREVSREVSRTHECKAAHTRTHTNTTHTTSHITHVGPEIIGLLADLQAQDGANLATQHS